MPVHFLPSTIVIPAGTVGLFVDFNTVTFPSAVLAADVAINGFKVQQDSGLARHFTLLEVNASINAILGADVEYAIGVQLVDTTGNESYNGFVQVLVFGKT